jgi:hypothetical protein
MKLELKSLGVTLDTERDLCADYELFQRPISKRQYQERIIRHFSMMTMMAVLMHALKEIGDGNVENPSDYVYKAMHEATKFSPEFIANQIGYSGYGEVIN